VIQWDKYYKAQRYTIWYTALVKEAGKWKLGSRLHDLLHGGPMEAPTGIYDFDDELGSFDIGLHGIAYAVEDPTNKRPELHGASTVYYVPLSDFRRAATVAPEMMTLPDEMRYGLVSNVKISPDGRIIGFLYRTLGKPETHVMVFGYVHEMVAFDAFQQIIGEKAWLPPDGFEWAGTNDSIFVLTDDCGRMKLSLLCLKFGSKPITLVSNGCVTAFHPLQDGNADKLLVSSMNYLDSSLWQVIDVAQETEPRVVSSATKHGAKFGLSHSMVSEFWYEGEHDIPVHCWILKPADFDESKKYPWVLLPHGGPESASRDAWSTRVRVAGGYHFGHG
jgi:hypothetical protein